jgi:2-iminobutanoate/2-iminopropanoate deaminase
LQELEANMPRTAIDVPGATAVGPYSHAVKHEGLFFFSGQTPLDPATGRLVEGGITAQVERCLQNLFSVAAASGVEEEDVLKVNVFLTDMAQFAEMNAAYERFFTPPYPARTTIAVVGLPRGAQVEIEMVAARGRLARLRSKL